jgi:hypothetical protein
MGEGRGTDQMRTTHGKPSTYLHHPYWFFQIIAQVFRGDSLSYGLLLMFKKLRAVFDAVHH